MLKAMAWLSLLLLGWFLGEYAFKPTADYVHDWWTRPEKILTAADQRRSIPSKDEVNAAIEQYTALIDAKHPTKKTSVRAEIGLSRAYSQMARLRDWMGYPRGDYPALAVTKALNAQRNGASDPDVGIALAYAYAFGGKTSANEMAIAKIDELRSRFSASSDLDYLAWVGRENPENDEYLAKVQPNTVPDVTAMIDVALVYVLKAKDAPSDKDKEPKINRAAAFLERADLGAGQGLPLVKFVHAQLEDAQGHNDDAKQYYEEALKIDRDFPRAKINLGTLYATMEPPNFLEAAQKFEDVARMPGIPLSTQRTANINLGEADVELGKIDEACSHWAIAADISKDAPSPFRDLGVFYARVMCNAARGKMKDAIEGFRSMPHGDEIAKQVRAMGPGPRERCLLNAVLDRSTQPRCDSPSHFPSTK